MVNERKEESIYLTPTPVRIWHWLNALGIVTLCITGIQIRFPEYVNIFGTYKAAVRLHNTAGVTVAVSFLIWFVYYLFVARNLARIYFPSADDIKQGLFRQAFFYFYQYFLGKENPHRPTPENKFNAIQKMSYLMIMFVLMPCVTISGILLMNIAPIRGFIVMIGGLKYLIGIHYIVACSLFAFLCVHIYMATLGHTPFSHFKTMWTGWEVEES